MIWRLLRDGVDLTHYLPPFLKTDATYLDAQDTLSWEHENLRVKLLDTWRQFYLQAATWSLADWEEFVGLRANSDDIDARRLRVQAKLAGARVMNLRNTNELVRSFTDGNSSRVEEFAPNSIRFRLTDNVIAWDDLLATLTELMPAHLALSFLRRQVFFAQAYVGLAQGFSGFKQIALTVPANLKQTLHAAQAFTLTGEQLFSLNKPADFKQSLQVAQFLLRGGSIRIDSATALPVRTFRENPLADLLLADIGFTRDVPNPARADFLLEYAAKIFAAQIQASVGSKTYGLTRPTNELQKLVAAQIQARSGSLIIAPATDRFFSQQIPLHAAQILLRAGNILVNSDTQPTTPPDKIFQQVTTHLNAAIGVGVAKFGSVTLKPRTFIKTANLNRLNAGSALILSGQVTIGAAEDDLNYDVPLGEWLRLVLQSDSGTRLLTIKNPKHDLDKDDIRKVTEQIIRDKILLDANGNLIVRVPRAILITLSERKIF